MEIRHLRLVKAIVEEGSITRAIDTLHLTQSALSHQLKEAEQQLGTKIFLRMNKKLVLTKAGEKVYELALEILDKLGPPNFPSGKCSRAKWERFASAPSATPATFGYPR